MFRRLSRPLRHGALLLGFLFIRGWVTVTPRRLALAVGAVLGRLAFAAGGSSRDGAVARLKEILGYDDGRARATARAMYRHFALDFVDLLIFGGWRRRRFSNHVRVEGFEHIERAMAVGRGVVGLTAHLCNWELLGGYVASRVGGIAVLAHPAYDRFFNTILVNYRRRWAVKTIYRNEPAAVPLKWLRDGGFLGTLADQDIPDMPWVVVDFIGKPARTPVGPALLARRAGASLVPIYIVREEGNDYRIVAEGPLAKSAAPKVGNAVAEDTAAWSAVVGGWVRAHPEQWVWVHERWRPT